MNEVAGQTTCEWQMIAIQLDIDEATIKQIEKSSERNRCLSKVFNTWKDQHNPPFTWEVIIEVLNSPTVKEHRRADILKKMFS